MNEVENQEPSGGCLITLLVFMAILFLSLALVGPHLRDRSEESECPPYMDSAACMGEVDTE
jgi:hypothetical protein